MIKETRKREPSLISMRHSFFSNEKSIVEVSVKIGIITIGLILEVVMKTIIAVSMIILVTSISLAKAEEVKIGVLLSFTGPIEGLVPAIAEGAELAMKEVNISGGFLGGSTVTPIRADATCVDAGAATTAAERLVTANRVNAIMGSDCSGVTTAALQSVAIPNGIVMISPASTSPALSTIEDDGLFFRTAPSDARQGQVMAEIISERGFSSVALTYVNNDYGKGLADAFIGAFEGMGGEVTISASHDEQKGDYSAEVGTLASAGGELLVVAGYYLDGRNIVRGSLDSGSFDTFVFPDGMYSSDLLEGFDDELNGSFGQAPGAPGDFKDAFITIAGEADIDGNGPFVGEGYDAAALIMLAMQAAGSSDSNVFKDRVFDVANAPGEPIYPGELGKAIAILTSGGEIDYVGASGVELIEPGEAAGVYQELEIVNGAWEVVGFK